MIKVSVLYPNAADKKFDIDYYCNNHIPLVRRLLGDACKNVSVDYGIAGGEPGSKPAYFAMGHLFFDSAEDFVTSFTPHSAAILEDIPKYTDTTPVVQISEIKI